MAAVINRLPEDIITPSCRKFRCYEKFSIPYKDRTKVQYCPGHDHSGYWTQKQASDPQDPANHMSIEADLLYTKWMENEAVKIMVKGKRYALIMVSPSGKRVKISMGGNSPRAMWYDETEGLVAAK